MKIRGSKYLTGNNKQYPLLFFPIEVTIFPTSIYVFFDSDESIFIHIKFIKHCLDFIILHIWTSSSLNRIKCFNEQLYAERSAKYFSFAELLYSVGKIERYHHQLIISDTCLTTHCFEYIETKISLLFLSILLCIANSRNRLGKVAFNSVRNRNCVKIHFLL